MAAQRKRDNGLDILKAVASFFVVCIHAPVPSVWGRLLNVVSRFAVPCFFMISGYFYPEIWQAGRWKKQVKKIVFITFVATVLYFFISLSVNLYDGASLEQYFIWAFDPARIPNLLFMNEAPWGGHLWYLFALLYVLLIAEIIGRFGLEKLMFIATPVLLLACTVLGNYSMAFLGRSANLYLTRNFLFTGLPYFYAGHFIAAHKDKWTQKSKLITWGAFAGAAIFAFTSCLEFYILESRGLSTIYDHYFSTPFLAVCVFLFFLKLPEFLDIRFLVHIGKEYSLLVYILHLAVVTLLERLAGRMLLREYYDWVAPVLVYAVSLLLSVVFLQVWCLVRRKLTTKP